MTRFLIDVRDPNPTIADENDYTLVGDGPIRTAMQWRSVARLSRGGSWAFDMPATDPRARYPQKGRYIQCYLTPFGIGEPGGGLHYRDIGGGRVDSVRLRETPDGPVLTVEGLDPLAELGSIRTVGTTSYSAETEIFADLIGDANARMLAAYGLPWNRLTPSTNTTAATMDIEPKTTLAALIDVSERIGEHFRNGTGSREVEWIGPASGFAASNLLVVGGISGGASTNSYVCAASEVEQVKDGSSVVTRLFVTCENADGTNITLASATDPAPSGLTRNTSESWLEDGAATDASTLHEHAIHYSDIRAATTGASDVQAAANLMQAAAAEYLRTHADVYEYYRMRLVECQRIILPGQTIKAQILRSFNGALAVNIQATLTVLEAEYQLDASGLRTVAVLCASIDRWPDSDAEALIRKLIS